MQGGSIEHESVSEAQSGHGIASSPPLYYLLTFSTLNHRRW